MNALDKITDEIMSEAKSQSEKIISVAQSKAKEIAEEAESRRLLYIDRANEEIEKECREIMQRAESYDRQSKRRALLDTRNKLIDEVIAEAKKQLEALSVKQYFDLMFKLFSKNARPLDGEICFAPSDYARIPKGFIDKCKALFPENALELSEETGALKNGFIIKYGDIYENCSIDGIFASNSQLFRDKANEILQKK